MSDYSVVYEFTEESFLYAKPTRNVFKREVVVFKGTQKECREYIVKHNQKPESQIPAGRRPWL